MTRMRPRKNLATAMKKSKEPAKSIPCSECGVGRMHLTSVAYFTWLGDEMISVPDFPAWVCDICGQCEYDDQALNQLSLLLSPTLVKSTLRKAATVARKGESKHKGTQPAAQD